MLSSSSLARTFINYLGLYAQVSSSGAGHSAKSLHPTVTLDNATFIGLSDELTNQFFGIPYAQPPTGKSRFTQSVAVPAYIGTHNASTFGPVCPQQSLSKSRSPPPDLDLRVVSEILGIIHDTSAPESEDCLSLNVWTPSDVLPGSGLPIVVYIHGGAYQIGSGAFADGKVVVERSIQIGEPVIFVSINYRLSALGWLTGKEAEAAGLGNLGYRDQRLALQWVQKYIHSFGGDPSKVVLWGQSAGAMSILAQMVTNNGNVSGLFRGAYLQSGSFVPQGDMKGSQRYYDDLVAEAGCQGAQLRTLECLRDVPFERLKRAMDASPVFTSYGSLGVAWSGRADGDFLVTSPRELISRGVIADVPLVIGTTDDEGTLFALPSLNVSTTSDVSDYLFAYFMHNATVSSIEALLNTHYPDDPSFGSPFGTGTLNAVTPQFKRLAAILGDYVFEAPKRILLEAVAGTRDVWTYVSKRQKNDGVLGSAHSTDTCFGVFGPSDMTDHLIYFVNHLNPNGLEAPSARGLDITTQQLTSHLQANSTLDAHPVSSQTLAYNEGQAPLHSSRSRGTVWPKFTWESKAVLTYLDGEEDGVARTQVVHGFEREEAVRYLQDLSKVAWIP